MFPAWGARHGEGVGGNGGGDDGSNDSGDGGGMHGDGDSGSSSDSGNSVRRQEGRSKAVKASRRLKHSWLSVLSLNVQGAIRRNIGELESYLLQHKIDVAAIQEAQLSTSAKVEAQGYKTSNTLVGTCYSLYGTPAPFHRDGAAGR